MPLLLQVSYRRNTLEKILNFAYVDLEKSFDRVTRAVERWAMGELDVDEWLRETIMAMNEFSNNAVRVNNTIGNKSNVEVPMHQGSVLSPLLFFMVLEALSRGFRSSLLWEMLYVDDLVIIAESGRVKYLTWKTT